MKSSTITCGGAVDELGSKAIIVRVVACGLCFDSYFCSSFMCVCVCAYACSWSVSFYPQVLLNYRRKTSVGLSFDFLIYNVLAFSCYAAFTCE